MIPEFLPWVQIFFSPQGIGRMRRVNQIALFRLGGVQRLLSVIYGDDYSDVAALLRAFAEDALNQRELPSSVAEARATAEAIEQRQVKFDDPEALMWVSLRVSRFKNLLQDELARLPTYIVEQVRAYSSNDLLEHAENHFSESIRSKLRPEAVADFREAAGCLLFERFTASAFHALRILESCSRQYYEIVTSKTFDPDNPLRWKVVIDQLASHLAGEKKQGLPNTELLELVIVNLQPMKDIFRNQIFHPETTLDREQAIGVFEIVARVVSWMIEDAERRAPGRI